MAYRNILIASEAHLKLSDNQLKVDNGTVRSFPIEDIRSIVLDQCRTTVTVQLLSELGNAGVCVILCDSKHLPCAFLSPMAGFCRTLPRMQQQVAQTKPRQKRQWQAVVVQKIRNQAICLALAGKEAEAAQLKNMASAVQSGDSTNRESYAAALYFKALFGSGFSRGLECPANAKLNYGYAIFRSYIAKTMAAYGLEPSLGIHHENQLNAFNLADDFIEPFRPMVDIYTALHTDLTAPLDTVQKGALQKLLNCRCTVEGRKWSAAKAIDLLVQSYVSSLEQEDGMLKLPAVEDTFFFDDE